MKEHKLSAFNIAFLYIGAIMGAGFASGREIWQFFGVFGLRGYLGIAFVGILFICFGAMAIKVSQRLETNDIAKILLPFKNALAERILGWIVSGFLFLIYMTTSAAGGALFQEQFGIHRFFGGLVLLILVIATVLGGFQRISKYFKYIVPALLLVVFVICMYIIFFDLPKSGLETVYEVSPMAPNWWMGAVIYISYNMLGGIIILGSSADKGVKKHSAIRGALLGGVLLGAFVLLMNATLFTDTGLSSTSVLPVLSFSDKMGTVPHVVYAILLFGAIYVTATSNFYGLTTRIKPSGKQNLIVVLIAVVGFLMGLMGFVSIVAWVLPLEGYIGLCFLIFMTVNFLRKVR